MKVLYLGNKFKSYKKISSTLETLEPLLSEFCEIKTASGKKNQILRAMEMFRFYWVYGIRADKIMIDVFSTRAFYFAYFFTSLSAFFDKRYILILHGGNLPYRYTISRKKMNTMLCKADTVIAPSAYLQQFFSERGYNIRLIPNIINLNEYIFRERSIIRPKLLSIRGFGKPYNPLMTIKAVECLIIKYPEIRLLILGNSEEHYYNEVVKYINEKNLNSYVMIEPKMSKADWINLSKDYDIMISNPIIDNSPVSIIEGMALGMCVISTKVGGVSYLVSEKECALIESNNEKVLSETIEKLLCDFNYAKNLSTNGRLMAEKYDWGNIKNLWENVLLK